tara:strand:+ start:2427 stop:3065 length:639 start_codon:yes stop_codon:yes gene_type:complete
MATNLPVVEQFHSLQGEGAHAGRSAYFIRLASCKVGCPWCDTKQSWEINDHPQKSIIELSKSANQAREKGAAFVVITGGEPLHHNLNNLNKAIRQTTKKTIQEPMPIHIETSGVDSISGNPDWITLSPKQHAPPKIEVLESCHELKVIINTKDDLLFAESMLKTIDSKQQQPILFLQAGWNNKTAQELAFDYVKKHSKWRLSMQTHKWLGVL